MKGQITKHEWIQSEGYSWLSICKHCDIDRVLDLNVPGRIFYNLRSPLIETTTQEPPCITRKTQADGDSTAT